MLLPRGNSLLSRSASTPSEGGAGKAVAVLFALFLLAACSGDSVLTASKQHKQVVKVFYLSNF
jgi:hypothetical protein